MSSCIQPALVINSFMYHSFYLITGPSKLIVTLKGEVKDAQPNIAGTYVLEPKLENGKSHWLQHTGTNAIWWYKKNKFWAIGPQDNRTIVSIISFDNVASPEEATTWQYVDALEKLIISDNILVDTFVEKGTYKYDIVWVYYYYKRQRARFVCADLQSKQMGG